MLLQLLQLIPTNLHISIILDLLYEIQYIAHYQRWGVCAGLYWYLQDAPDRSTQSGPLLRATTRGSILTPTAGPSDYSPPLVHESSHPRAFMTCLPPSFHPFMLEPLLLAHRICALGPCERHFVRPSPSDLLSSDPMYSHGGFLTP